MSSASRSGAGETALPAPHSTLARPLIVATVLSVLLLFAAAGLKSYRDLTAAREHEAQLKAQIELTQANVERLHRRIQQLNSDPAALERVAREDLGMVKPGDVVIVLPEPETR